MAISPKGKRKTAGKGATPAALASRLKALADRLASGAEAPAGLLGEVEAALEAWERGLEAQTVLPLQTPSDGSDAGGGDTKDGGVAGDGLTDDSLTGDGLIRIWCDGSCAPNPGAGGWGAIVEKDGAREELSGSALESTNNIMEMTAAIEALRHTPQGARILLTTDSQYVKNGITKWIHAWKRRGWRKADGGAVLNQQQWRELDALAATRRVEWAWIRGHTGHAENERCDELAGRARLAQST